MSEPLIHDVTDTARWVAIYRARESERPDAIFRDPYARRLGGERGERIVRSINRWGLNQSWAFVTRTRVIDELIEACVSREEIDTAINLGAGLDCRPYRLRLPPGLRWIEVDLPGILDYKEDRLAGEQPICRLERIRLDLSDKSARRELFSRLASASYRGLILAEGVLLYLDPDDVRSLSGDLAIQYPFRWWLMDLAPPPLLKYGRDSFARAPLRFAPDEGPDFFNSQGWRTAEFRSYMEEAHRLKRLPRLFEFFRLLGRIVPDRGGWSTGGMTLLERADGARDPLLARWRRSLCTRKRAKVLTYRSL